MFSRFHIVKRIVLKIYNRYKNDDVVFLLKFEANELLMF